MSNDPERSDLEAIEQQLRAAMPADPSDSQLETVHAHVTADAKPARKRTLGRVAGVALAVTVLAAITTNALLGGDTSAPAFAYDSAANTILPQDAVLHVMLRTTRVPIPPGTPPEAVNSDFTSEYWIDAATDRSRLQSTYELDSGSTKTVEIDSDGRIRELNEWPDSNGETRYTYTERPSDVRPLEYVPDFSLPYWLERTAQGIRTGDCEVTNETTFDGEAAWLVTWQTDHDWYRLHTEVLLRRSDYRPLTIRMQATALEGEDLGDHFVWGWEVTSWETIDGESAADLFDVNSLRDSADFAQIRYDADDSALAEFDEFPVWWLGTASSAGSFDGAIFQEPWEFGPSLEGRGAITFTYGLPEIGYGLDHPGIGEGMPDSVSVSTFDTQNREAIEAWWTGVEYSGPDAREPDMMGPDYLGHTVGGTPGEPYYQGHEVRGTVNGLAYHMFVQTEWAHALVFVDGYPVVIMALDEVSVLEALAELEPLRN